MIYTIKFTNTYKSANPADVIGYDLSTISPSLIVESTYIDHVSDLYGDADGFVSIPLYKRNQFCMLPPNSSLTIETEDSREFIYYNELNIDNCHVSASWGSGGELRILEPSGGTDDRTADIMLELQTNGVCVLGNGDFYTSGIDMPEGTSIIGLGKKSKLILNTEVGSVYAIKMNSNCTVKDLFISGGSFDYTSEVGDRDGILWAGSGSSATSPINSVVSGCYITGFSRGGITCYRTSSGSTNHLMASQCFIENCGIGINIEDLSEFNKFESVRTNLCGTGCVNQGGNNIFIGCDFSKCTTGFVIDNTDQTHSNNGHGSAIGCVFNHMNNNTGYAVIIKKTGHAFTFVGCQIFFANILVNDAAGVSFSACVFGKSSNITVDQNGGFIDARTLFSDCTFGDAPTITASDNTVFKNCYVRGGDGEKIDNSDDIKYNDPLLTIIDDDGNMHFLTDIVPLIEEEKIPIASAVVTNKVGADAWHMDWDDIAEANDKGAEILNHTYNHRAGSEIPDLDEDTIVYEYQMAKNTFDRHGFTSCDIVVYSSSTGGYAKVRRSAEKVFKCGIKIGGMVSNNAKSDRFGLSRYRIDYASTEGGTDWDINAMKSWVDDCVANGGWMIWMLHTSNADGGDYCYTRRIALDGNGDPIYDQSTGLPVPMDSAQCHPEPGDWSIGGISSTDGSANDSGFLIRTDYMPIEDDFEYKFTGVLKGDGETTNRVHINYYYDANKTYLGRSDTVISEGAKYVRFTYGFTTTSGIRVENYGQSKLESEWSAKIVGHPVYDKWQDGNSYPHMGSELYVPMLKEAIQYAKSKGIKIVTAHYALNKYFGIS